MILSILEVIPLFEDLLNLLDLATEWQVLVANCLISLVNQSIYLAELLFVQLMRTQLCFGFLLSICTVAMVFVLLGSVRLSVVSIRIAFDEIFQILLLLQLFCREALMSCTKLFVLLLSFKLFLSYHGRIVYITDGKVLTEMVFILFNKVHHITGQVLSLGYNVGLVDTFQEQLGLHTVQSWVEVFVADLVDTKDLPNLLNGPISRCYSQRTWEINGDLIQFLTCLLFFGVWRLRGVQFTLFYNCVNASLAFS
jgi:hypothetical protein